MLRAPRFYVDIFFTRVGLKQNVILFYLRLINHVNMITFFYKQRVTCEKNDLSFPLNVTTPLNVSKQVYAKCNNSAKCVNQS